MLAAKVAASAYLLAGACWVVVGVGYVVGQIDNWPAFLLGSAALIVVACPVLVMSCLCRATIRRIWVGLHAEEQDGDLGAPMGARKRPNGGKKP